MGGGRFSSFFSVFMVTGYLKPLQKELPKLHVASVLTKLFN